MLMFGLARTEARGINRLSSANLEALATMAIAWLVFRENVDRRLITGAAAVLAGAVTPIQSLISEVRFYIKAIDNRKGIGLPKIRDTIFVHANSSDWRGDLQPFLCLGVGAAGPLCLATTVSIASRGFLGRSGRGSTAHTNKLAPAKARMPHS